MTCAEAIKIIESEILEDIEEELLLENAVVEKWEDALELAVHALKLQEARWISVEERLPERADFKFLSQEFLVRIMEPADRGGVAKHKTRVVAYDLLRNEWRCEYVVVTHWMPLPFPPMSVQSK